MRVKQVVHDVAVCDGGDHNFSYHLSRITLVTSLMASRPRGA